MPSEPIFTGAECWRCLGAGSYAVARFDANGQQYAETKPCRTCRGTGRAYPQPEPPHAE